MANSAAATCLRQISAREYDGNVRSSDLTDRLQQHTQSSGIGDRSTPVQEALHHDSGTDLKYTLSISTGRLQRYGHRPAVVLSRSGPLRKSLEQALFARGAAVANLGTLPASGQVHDLLTSGLIVLAPPDDLQPDTGDWIEAAEATSIKEAVRAVLHDLEHRGVLVSSGLVFPGEGI